MDISLGLYLVIVWEAVHFVDEHFKIDLRIDTVGSGNSEVKPAQRLHVIILIEDSNMLINMEYVHLLKELNREAGYTIITWNDF